MKNFSAVSKKKQEEFFNSFDHILCDVDGVLWHLHEAIPGSSNAIKSLKKLGKTVTFVSNNCTRTHNEYYQKLDSLGVVDEKSDLIIPTLAMIDYLQKQNFSKEIYVIGMAALKSELENAGFKIAEYAPDSIEESIAKYLEICCSKNEKVGAVIADLDINMNVMKLQKGATHLMNPETIFITGGSDKQLYFGPGNKMIGPGNFHNILEDMTGRTPICLAKPSLDFNNFIKEKCHLGDPSRVLFIGDSIPEDMGFATRCGYRKLLVVSGLTKKEELENWKFPENYKPEYYVASLKNVEEALNSIHYN